LREISQAQRQEFMARIKKVVCPNCKASSAMRIQRSGFLQESVLVHLGIYPWKCGACGRMFLFRSRGYHSRSHKLVHKANVTDPNQDSLS